MPHAKLTKTFIDALPLSPGKQIFYRDNVTTGFGVCVGGTKSYFVEKKMPNGKAKRKIIGKHGVYTLEQARTIAKELLINMDQGIDPIAEKRKIRSDAQHADEIKKQIPTLYSAFENYIANKDLSKASIFAYTRCMAYMSDWHNVKITELTEKMVLSKHKELSASNVGPAQANLTMKFLSALFNYSKKFYSFDGEKIIKGTNSVSVLYELSAWNTIKRRRNYVRSDQREDWAIAVTTTHWIGQQNDDLYAYTNQDYLLLIACTGFRREEAERVEWSKVDLKYGTITVTDTKNGEDLMLPIGDTLLYILKERKKRSTSPYVFPGKNPETHIIDRRIAREKVIENAGIQFTYHDLRRTFSSIANSLAIGSYTIKRLINHTTEDSSNDVTDGYVQVSFDDLKKAMNMIEDVVLPEQAKQLIKNRIYFEKGSRRNFDEDWEKYINSVLISD